MANRYGRHRRNANPQNKSKAFGVKFFFYDRDRITVTLEPHDHKVATEVLGSFSDTVYLPEKQHWLIPEGLYEDLLQELRRKEVDPYWANLIPEGALKAIRQFKDTASNLDLDQVALDIPNALRETLFPFQMESAKLMVHQNGRMLLADEMGLGKTIQALAVAAHFRHDWNPLLIITPASMVATWAQQLRFWLSDIVDQSKIAIVYTGKVSILDAKVIIASYDLASKLVQSQALEPSLVIADESHMIKNYNTKRCRTLLPVIARARRALLLTGTPVLSRPMDLFTQLGALQPTLFPNHHEFGTRYCDAERDIFGWNYSGTSNLKELLLVLPHLVIRRSKKDVLADLPSKMRKQVVLELNSKEMKEYHQSFKKTAENSQAIIEMAQHLFGDYVLEEGSHEYNPRVAEQCQSLIERRRNFMELHRISAQLKCRTICAYLDHLLESTPKIIVFAHHRSVLDYLEEHLLVQAGRRYMRIDGSTAAKQRQVMCDLFQNDSNVSVALLSITAAHSGITLTAASCVVFAELFWNPGILLQAEDRAHRIGQLDSVTVHYLLAKGTTDDSIWPLVLNKLKTMESLGLGTDEFTGMNQANLQTDENKGHLQLIDIPSVEDEKSDVEETRCHE